MKKIQLISSLLVMLQLLIGVTSCKKDSIIENSENTRISRIKLEEWRKFHDYWVVADIGYVDDKIASINLNHDIHNSNSGQLSQYEYGNQKYSRYDYIIGHDIEGKETYAFNETNLIEWSYEIYNDNQFLPFENIHYEYENNNLISFTHFIETLIPYKHHILSYEGTKIQSYKAFFSSAENLQSRLDNEGLYNYKDDTLLYIDRNYYYTGTNYRYSLVYEGSKIIKIHRKSITDSELNFFEFSYDESGRIKTINYRSGIENSYITASAAKWTFEYENGKSNLIFDTNKILWKIMVIDQFHFPEKIVNDFFTILP